MSRPRDFLRITSHLAANWAQTKGKVVMKTITKMFEVMLTKSATPTWTVSPAAGGPVSQWGWGG